MLEVLLIRPGSTTFDEDGRIKGSLDIPLSPRGIQQVEAAARTLSGMKLDCLYAAPCESRRTPLATSPDVLVGSKRRWNAC